MESVQTFLFDYMYGILNLGIWGYALAMLIMVQITMMAVTLYLHRDQAHRAITLNPVLRHFFRFWIWCTSGMLTREWVAVHRKHHAFCETEDDPHSPKIYGLKKVLLEGAELYRDEKNKPETIEKYGRGAPDDWLEREVYLRFPYAGILLLIVSDLVLFGAPGIIMIAIQLAAMPVFAAGVINGLGHHTGYRNFECDDAATNITPLAIFTGGEELHNNHHAFPTSAKFSVRPWEFDIGWGYIRVFQALGLARVNKLAPKPVMDETPDSVDLETVRAIIVNRMHVLRDYTRQVTLPVFKRERSAASNSSMLKQRVRKLLVRQPKLLDDSASKKLKELLDSNAALETVHQFRERLRELWNGAHDSNERLLAHLKEWCAEAEASGIKVLQDFSRTLQAYTIAPQAA